MEHHLFQVVTMWIQEGCSSAGPAWNAFSKQSMKAELKGVIVNLWKTIKF